MTTVGANYHSPADFFLFRANDNSPLQSSELSLDKFHAFALIILFIEIRQYNGSKILLKQPIMVLGVTIGQIDIDYQNFTIAPTTPPLFLP
ncbi:hypothetical protein D0T57_14695 [Dysgonomonas sp. 511]|nr:hypothetical protein [Dysgonomonas sp. 511]